MKVLSIFILLPTVLHAKDLSSIYENIFKFNNLDLVSVGITECESQHVSKDYFAFCNALPYLENKEVLKFSNRGNSVSTEKIETGDFSSYTDQDHTRHYLRFQTSQGEVPSALLNLASSVTVISKDYIPSDLGPSPFLSFFEKDKGAPLGMALVNVESSFGKIKNKIIYTTRSEKNFIGFDFLNILGNFSITRNSFSLEGDDVNCSESCVKVPLNYEAGQFYLKAEVDGYEYSLLLDTSSEISSVPNKLNDAFCINDFNLKDNLSSYEWKAIKDQSISLCQLETKIRGLPVFKNYYLAGLNVEGERGVLGMNFFNSFDKVVFDIKEDYLYVFHK
ncbi:hypothetical protein [Marinomonas fungiae]|uniref:hypothetical protein n=1 Tax=Marinomonas fungiae TaxID=1137284 RepID=UPI003A8E0554